MPAAALLPAVRVEPPKRAEQIATALESAILEERWQPGDRIGNESSLAREFGVSRWTMREAIAILEQAGTVVARRGAGGGLFIAAPAVDLVRNSLGAYLELSLTPFEAIAETRIALAAEAACRAAEHLDNAARIDLARLVIAAEQPGNAAIEAMGQARIRLRELTRNRPLALFLAVLADVGLHACWLSALDDAAFIALIDRLTAATRRHALAMIADRIEFALEAEREAVHIMGELHRASAVSGLFPAAPNAFERSYALHPSGHSAKKAERVAWAIRQRIGDGHLAAGTVLGSEEALMEQYAVGRPVLREAIRILERLGAVAMRRSGASGLTVAQPDPAHVIALARDYFRRDPPSAAERETTANILSGVAPANPVAQMMLAILR